MHLLNVGAFPPSSQRVLLVMTFSSGNTAYVSGEIITVDIYHGVIYGIKQQVGLLQDVFEVHLI